MDLSIEHKYLLELHHPATDNRIMAARSLGELKSCKALSEFERMLREEKEYSVLREVVLALKRIQNPQARRLLETAMKHPHYLISYQARLYLDLYTK